MKWTVTLKGDPCDLKSLAGLGVGVTEEGHAFVLRSPDFDRLTDAGVVQQRASELVEDLNGLARLELGDYDPVEVGPITADDGKGMHYLFAGDTLQLRGRERHKLVDGATGQPIAQPDASTDLLRLLAVARRDPNIRRALRFFLSPTAQNLHKVYEIIRDDAGGEAPDVVNKGWATALDIDRFRSVHYPSALGEEARHGVEPKRRAAPVDPMSLAEARAFIGNLLKLWLASK